MPLAGSKRSAVVSQYKGSLSEKRLAAAEAAAEQILENILHRKRWSAPDRDRLAQELINFAIADANRRQTP